MLRSNYRCTPPAAPLNNPITLLMKPLFRILFQQYWNPYLVLALAGILSALYFALTSTVWAVTGEFTRLGGDLLLLLGIDATQWQYFQLVKLGGTTWTRADGWIV